MNKENLVLPLISCIMPTYNRRAFVPHAIRYFLRQDYPHKELIIIDDGTDAVEDLIPRHDAVRYLRLPQKITLGAKLNMACEMANGDIIMNWDDDDWYSPDRISYQASAMTNEQTFICGINKLLYFDLATKKTFQYVYPAGQRTWLLGSSQCYRKDFWAKNRFADINVGMDGLFVWSTTDEHIHVMPDNNFAVHMIHDTNISPKQTHTGWWHQHPAESIRDVMKEDWEFYNNNGSHPLPFEVKGYVIKQGNVNKTSAALKNVYACLVHEKEDCIIDLIRNLHYHDPESAIILFNGGEDKGLFSKKFPFAKYNVHLYPNPAPVKWGYLHNFALKCMEFAIDNLSFDIITIVDSDQLAVRKGYARYLTDFLKNRQGVGMLSSKPEKVHPHDRTNPVACQAYNEFELWKPLLQMFPDGENKFVHWTFWPSTVFTAAAAKDLTDVFKKNTLLQQIMTQTKIWATEEVILPTLVKLLGYEIEKNPCSYDFVKYKVQFTPSQAAQALDRSDVYWMHPVNRQYDDRIRKSAREFCKQYALPHHTKTARVRDIEVAGVKDFTSLHKNIKGWLSDNEAELLVSSVLLLAKEKKLRHAIVEVGSYEGKATVLLGAVAKKLQPGVMVYAVDPHDGKLGAADQGYVYVTPSYEQLKENIRCAGLDDSVTIIRSSAPELKWNKKISFLLIDGLHDYPSVSNDFWHFAKWVAPGGYVAFHDYADYFPGVKSFVDELSSSGSYSIAGMKDSLVILQKTSN